MEKVYYLAIDIGASSGRHILSWLEDGKMMFEEVYRFPNGLTDKNGTFCWDHKALVEHVKAGIKKCGELGRKPSYLGIDTWGVDFVLIDKDGKMIGDSVGYRDGRTNGMDEEVYKIIPEKELYARTGIQKQIYNTVYQLMALKQQHPEQLEAAEHLLLMPDFLNYMLTGKIESEYTDASTTQLLNIETNDWDRELITMLGYPEKIFGKLSMPGEIVGNLLPEVKNEVGFDLTVVHPASHDTASAVLAVPTNSDNVIYLSSGTWSLMGVESLTPIHDEISQKMNFTNEGGYNYRYRYLKNIMGLWIIQSIRKECGGAYDFNALCKMAEDAKDTKYRINVNDGSFLMPKSMTEAIRAYCKAPEMTLGEVLGCVYNSLSECYAETIKEISQISGKKIEALHIIGGGSKDRFLNELTAEKAGIPVYAGPTEATAIGNILSVMLGTGAFTSLEEARLCVKRSFDVNKITI